MAKKVTSIGGQALLEGIMMVGPNKKTAAFVGEDGSAPTLPCCSHPDYHPSAEEMAEYEALLKR